MRRRPSASSNSPSPCMQTPSCLPPILSPIRFRPLDVAALRGFLARAEQHDDGRTLACEVHPVPLAFANTQLEHSRTDRLPVARKSEPQAVALNENPRLRTAI